MSSKFIRTVKDIKLSKNLLMTPKITEWLTYNTDVVYDNEMIDLVVDILTDTSADIRHNRFGSSTRGLCLRRQVFTYLGVDQSGSIDYLLNNIYMDGRFRHLRWQLMGIESGALTHVEVPFALPDMRMSGSVDGLNEDEGWLFELKGAHMIPKEVPYKHLLQIHTYFLLTGYKRASYVVECKRTNDFREWVIEEDKDIAAAVRKELDDLNRAIDKKRLPPVLGECESETGSTWRSCPFRGICLGAVWPE